MPESRLNERTIRQIDQTYLGLRGRVFESTPEDIGLTSPEKEQAYAIIMDISLGNMGILPWCLLPMAMPAFMSVPAGQLLAELRMNLFARQLWTLLVKEIHM